MVRKLIDRIKRWIVKRVTNWEQYWGQTLPDYERVFKTQNGKIIKEDGKYWESISFILENAAFMQELSQLQDKLKTKACDAHSRLDPTQGSARWQSYTGPELVVKILLDAKNKTQENVANG